MNAPSTYESFLFNRPHLLICELCAYVSQSAVCVHRFSHAMRSVTPSDVLISSAMSLLDNTVSGCQVYAGVGSSGGVGSGGMGSGGMGSGGTTLSSFVLKYITHTAANRKTHHRPFDFCLGGMICI
jgi:hypothetical protein